MINKPIIEINNLTKKFKDLTAVNNISLKINEGEIFGLLGPNGAGKTTTISMLSTLLKPSSGTATINGHDIKKEPEKVRKYIGLVFQETILDLDLNATDNLRFHAELYKIPKKEIKDKIKEVLNIVNLSEHKKKKTEKFSGGMKRRLEIAKGLLHNPKILFLDEPTLGLDPQTRRKIWDYILNLKKNKKMTILLTTHYMEEADLLCDRIAIIDNGKIIVMDKPKKLKSKLRGDVIRVKVKNAEGAVKNLKKIKGLKVEISKNIISILTKDAEKKIASIIKIIEKNEIESVYMHKPTLDDVFLYYTGKEFKDDL